MFWSNLDKIRDIIGKKAIVLRTGDLDGTPCFLVGLPAEIWERDGKQVFPKVLIEQDPAPLAIPEAEPGPVGNSQEEQSPALAIPEEEPGPVGNLESAPLAIHQKEEI